MENKAWDPTPGTPPLFARFARSCGLRSLQVGDGSTMSFAQNKKMKILIILTFTGLVFTSCCPVTSVSIAPSLGYDVTKPTNITAAGTVKIEYGDYCPSKVERELIDEMRKTSFTLLGRYISDQETKEIYKEKQSAIQGAIEHIVSQGKGLAERKPAPERAARAVASAPATVVSGIATTLADTMTIRDKNQTVVAPAADPNASDASKQKAIAEARKTVD